MFSKIPLLLLSVLSFSTFQSLAMDEQQLRKEFDSHLYQEYYPCEIDPFEDWKNRPSGIAPHSPHEPYIVVSMTSHPPRINTTYLALESILRQTKKPNKIILYLAEDDFPEQSIPLTLEFLKRRGVEVRFSKINYKVATKLLPALQDFPEGVVIIGDDDRSYSEFLVEVLFSQHQKHPNTIISPHTRKYVWDNGNPDFPRINYLHQDLVYSNAPLPEGNVLSTSSSPDINNISSDVYVPQDMYAHGDPYTLHGEQKTFSEQPILGLIFEGFAGVLYPPYAFNKEVFNFDNFKQLTPCADDVWFQAMAVLNGTKVMGLDEKTAKLLCWPKEIQGTQESGLFHQHLSANDVMAYRVFHYYGLLSKLNIPTLDKMNCRACKRSIPLVKKGENFSVPSVKKGTKCKVCLNDSQKKILFIGAYDYGNIGDKLYKKVFKHYFGSDFDVHFVPDTVRINSSGDYIRFNSPETDFDFDALVIGGGGIIREFSSTSTISYYTNLARKNKKPFFLISVGMQTSTPNLTLSQAEKEVGSTIDLLKEAAFISPRSMRDYLILSGIMGDNGKGLLLPGPDLGYLYPTVINVPKGNEKKYITLIQTGSANVNQETVREMIKEKLSQFPSAELVVMNMGGIEHPTKKKDFREYDLFAVDAKQYFPNAIIYMGDSLSKALTRLSYSNAPLRKSDLTPKTATQIISQSHFVITGRYHGLVLARALGVPSMPAIYSYKMNAEKEWKGVNPDAALETIERLRYFLQNNSEGLPSPSKWNEDDRNHYIVMANKTYPQFKIPYLQSMDNVTLYKLLAFGSSELQ